MTRLTYRQRDCAIFARDIYKDGYSMGSIQKVGNTHVFYAHAYEDYSLDEKDLIEIAKVLNELNGGLEIVPFP